MMRGQSKHADRGTATHTISHQLQIHSKADYACTTTAPAAGKSRFQYSYVQGVAGGWLTLKLLFKCSSSSRMAATLPHLHRERPQAACPATAALHGAGSVASSNICCQNCLTGILHIWARSIMYISQPDKNLWRARLLSHLPHAWLHLQAIRLELQAQGRG